MAKGMVGSSALNGDSIDESFWVEQARAGDMNAFSRLLTRYQDRILNTCWRMCGNIEDARDLTQETFLQAIRSIQSFQQKAGFYTWLFRIAVNLCLSHSRKASRTPKLSLYDGDGQLGTETHVVGRRTTEPAPSPLARASAREIENIVLAELERLDDEHRAVIVLRDIEGFDYQQIAEILEIAVGTVKSRLHRARLELRGRLGQV